MSDETKGKSLLENAYRLATPDDNIAYYRDFSDSYDQDFADSLGFALPTEVARVFLARRMDDQGPVADLGCGTGLVGEALHGKVSEIDGLDISTEMLSVARSKGVYNALVQIDLTKSVEGYEQAYGAVLSSGTCTHGHLGPDAIDMALKLGRADCLFVLSVNLVHFDTFGFERKFSSLFDRNAISGFQTEDVAIYANTNHDHSRDRALIVSFRKSSD